MTNLFESLPAGAADEVISLLLEKPGLRVERIASFGHASPEGFWYDQTHDEWVLVVRGTATLRWDDGRREELRPGDFRLIPARCRHRVDRTDADTLWLAVHLAPASNGV